MTAVVETGQPAGRARGAHAVGRTHESFEDFYAAQWSDVAGYSTFLTGSRPTGDEVAQEAFARLFARWRVVREPRPYVFRIATNLARDTHRRAQRELPTDTMQDAAGAAAVDPHVLDAVHRLPERLRSVVLLHYYADLPLDQVAAALCRPLGSVKRQLHEARAALAIALGDHDD